MIKPGFQKQKPMQKVLVALIPPTICAVYFFGLRVLALVLICIIFALITEWITASRRKAKVTQACLVTALIYCLILPPTVPFWIAAVGIVVGILFGKEVFGGFGKNVFNPAIVGRAFVWICFPVDMTSKFVPSFSGFPGGFAQWSMISSQEQPGYLLRAGLDALTSATPMFAAKTYGQFTDLGALFLGNISGLIQVEGHPIVLGAGSMGEVSALAILLGGAWLLYTRAAQPRLMLSPILGALFTALLLKHVAGVDTVPDPLFVILSGGLLFAAVFMVTEPVTAPKSPRTQWIYGLFIGAMIVLLRYKGIFTGAVAFSILLGNMLAPSLDMWMKRIRANREKV
ncbi:RnfABCDGE type electron transport complex subunit D [Desulfonatronovibrio hydrogenovorans]|uniref:RnfABCDGE type electron transport complex subunit D n=1 Tax=Desulfonatronovibrio hydrogenovorans TaxID=53245 RepID=UPI00048C0002|nr:RnfABCDGE type electron transport complex subunit D [Desulfonatronovibrio hydrogenovorans]